MLVSLCLGVIVVPTPKPCPRFLVLVFTLLLRPQTMVVDLLPPLLNATFCRAVLAEGVNRHLITAPSVSWERYPHEEIPHHRFLVYPLIFPSHSGRCMGGCLYIPWSQPVNPQRPSSTSTVRFPQGGSGSRPSTATDLSTLFGRSVCLFVFVCVRVYL